MSKGHLTIRARRLRLAAVTVASCVAVVGCGGGESSDSDPEPSDSSGPTTTSSVGEPVKGGTLVYGLEADSDGFDPTKNRWAISGTMVGLAVFDPLAQIDEEGVARPYLAESIEPNDDFTKWMIKLRSGIKFHDDTPLDADAVVRTIEAHMTSFLTKPAISPIEAVTAVDDLTVEVTMNQPWVAFPAVLTAQVGVIPAPSMLDDKVDGASNPVGTGPFVFESWTQNEVWVGTRNENYWRDGLPYLDGVELRVVPEVESRLQALQGGDLDIMHSSAPSIIKRMQEDAENDLYEVLLSDGEGEESFIMLNMEKPPLDDQRVRTALAMATDRQRYIEGAADGLPPAADSLFTPESEWYSETEYPEYNPADARALIDEYETEVGPVEIELGTTNSTDNERSISLIGDMWADVGVDVEPVLLEQNTFIVEALGGNYQANLWRQFGAVDPDADSHWWRSDSTLNFARLKDPGVDEALLRGRSSEDPADRKEAYKQLQERFNLLIPYVWLHHSIWAVGFQNEVHGIAASFPDSEHQVPMGGNFTAVHLLTEMWKDG